MLTMTVHNQLKRLPQLLKDNNNREKKENLTNKENPENTRKANNLNNKELLELLAPTEVLVKTMLLKLTMDGMSFARDLPSIIMNTNTEIITTETPTPPPTRPVKDNNKTEDPTTLKTESPTIRTDNTKTMVNTSARIRSALPRLRLLPSKKQPTERDVSPRKK